MHYAHVMHRNYNAKCRFKYRHFAFTGDLVFFTRLTNLRIIIFALNFQAMQVIRNLCVLVTIITLASCNPQQAWRRHAITSKENIIGEKAKKGKVDTLGIKDLFSAYDAYVAAYPTDTNGANYLFRKADFCTYMRNPAKSIEIYRYIYSNYPDYKQAYALFMQGFTYENELHNRDSAKAKYELFLVNYPNHPFAKDVRSTLANIDKTPDQLIAEFEARQKADSLASAGAGK